MPSLRLRAKPVERRAAPERGAEYSGHDIRLMMDTEVCSVYPPIMTDAVIVT